MTQLAEKQKAPAIETKDQFGGDFSLEKLKGKKVILYFYPKDDTPGCTAEACSLRDNYEPLKKLGFEVVGISPDSDKSHKKFMEKYHLPFILLPDTDKKIVKDYGVWGEKKLYGKAYEGVLRTTFVIDEKGHIEKIIDKVRTGDHAAQIMEELNLKMSNN
ncbi:MAG: thioredoxin-dependent thiol peroxidase [Bacteroidia bacterium]|nr:thioredoxin-dependent thiol peroxidase [Bacteroidia bacterium]